MIDRMFRWWAKQFHEKDWQDCVKEWHTFWIGFAESFCFFIKPHFPTTSMAKNEMKNEWHYYRIGNVAGIYAWVLIVILVIRMFL